MKKKILFFIAFFAIVSTFFVNVQFSNKNQLVIKNNEALAQTVSVGRMCMHYPGLLCVWGMPDDPFIISGFFVEQQ